MTNDTSRQARLPKARRQKEIKDLATHEVGFTVPWAMSADDAGLLWLNPNYSIHAAPGGTVTMKVVRDAEGDYVVDVSGCKYYQWTARGIGEGIPVAVCIG